MDHQTEIDSELDPENGGRWRLLIDGSIVNEQAQRATPALRLAIDGSLSGAPHSASGIDLIDDWETDPMPTVSDVEPRHHVQPKLALFSEFAGR